MLCFSQNAIVHKNNFWWRWFPFFMKSTLCIDCRTKIKTSHMSCLSPLFSTRFDRDDGWNTRRNLNCWFSENTTHSQRSPSRRLVLGRVWTSYEEISNVHHPNSVSLSTAWHPAAKIYHSFRFFIIFVPGVLVRKPFLQKQNARGKGGSDARSSRVSI